MKSNRFSTGVNYFAEGVRLLLHPQLRVYILVPLVVNCLLFVVLTSVLLGYLSGLVDSTALPADWPGWVQNIVAPFKWVAWLIMGALFIIVYGYSFNVITNFIAAPFYGLLAEAAETLISGKAPKAESLWRMVPRVMLRELSKLLYFLLRGLLVILLMVMLGFIPLLQFAAPIIGLLWGAWAMSIQYADYAADNHQIEFSELRNRLWTCMRSSLGFGAAVMGCSMIPVLNILAMPAAVTGGTLLWTHELKKEK